MLLISVIIQYFSFYTMNTTTTVPLSRKAIITEAWQLIYLALPIIGNGLLEASFPFITVFFVAHLGKHELAANVLVSGLFLTIMVIFWGTILGVSVLIAHNHGAKNDHAISGIMRDSLWLALGASPLIIALLRFAPYFFIWAGEPLTIVKASHGYLDALSWAVVPDVLGFVLMQFFQGISKPKIVMIATLGYMPLLIGGTYILMFGKLGLPTFGLAGIGYATAFAYSVVFFGLITYIASQASYRKYFMAVLSRGMTTSTLALKNRYFKQVVQVGIPIGLTMAIEIGYFFTVGLFMGHISTEVLAGYQLVSQFFWIAVTVSFAFGQAVSIRLGWRLGRQENYWLWPLLTMGVCAVSCYALLIGLIYHLWPLKLIALDFGHEVTADISVVAIAILLFHSVLWPLLSNSIYIVFASVLRGLKDTFCMLLISLFSFWAIALALGFYWTFHLSPINPVHFWDALAIAQLLGAFILWWRIRFKEQQLLQSSSTAISTL